MLMLVKLISEVE